MVTKHIVLPLGTTYLTVREAPRLIANALCPPIDAAPIPSLVEEACPRKQRVSLSESNSAHSALEQSVLRRQAFKDDHKLALRSAIETGQLITRKDSMVPFAAQEGAKPTARIPVEDLNRYVADFGLTFTIEKSPAAYPPGVNPAAAAPRHVKATVRHEQKILAAITTLGIDPCALIPSATGTPGVRRRVRQLVGMTDSVFSKAWQRLLASGEIAYSPQICDTA